MRDPSPYAPPGRPSADVLPLDPPASVSVLAAIKFPFSRVGLRNVAIALLLMVIPLVGGLALFGWLAEIHRRLVRRAIPTVPSFSFGDFIAYLTAGVPAFVVQLAMSFAVTIPIGIGFGVFASTLLGSGGPPDPGDLVGPLAAVGGLGLIATMLAAVVSVPMLIRGELTGDVGRAFDLQAALGFARRNALAILGHHVLLSLLALPLLLAGMIVLFFGVYCVAAALQFSALHLRWQLYERDLTKGGPEIEPKLGL